MTILFLISAAVTIFLLAVTIFVILTAKDPVEARLMEVSAGGSAVNPNAPLLVSVPTTGLGRAAQAVTGALSPIRGLVSGADADLEYKLALAGFRKPQHVEIFTATKLLLPVVGVVIGSFFGNLLLAILVGAVAGFFIPDVVLTFLTKRRQDSIRRALPDALDLLVICMEAGLGIDQAMSRVGEEIELTSPALAEEFQTINRELRAGKPRLDAWRAMAARVDLDFIRQFIAMLVQTERFGTPIAHALGVFADTMRNRRTQQVEEAAAKTGVKLLFPLVFFIFPSIFVVTLGPAMLSIHKLFTESAK